jgi:hypothetical protein
MSTGYVQVRDALHTLLHTGVTGYLTTANIVNGDHRILDSGNEFAAVLERGDSAIQQGGPENTQDFIYEILVELWVRYKSELDTKDSLNLFIEGVKTRIEQNPAMLGVKGIVATGTMITAIDQPQEIFLRGVSETALPIFMMSIMHVQIEYRSRLTGGEFRS